MTSNVNVNVDLKGVNKLFDMLKSYFGVRIARRRAEEEAAAIVISAKANAEVKLLSALENLPLEPIIDAEFEIIWEEPEALALAQEHRSPLQYVEQKRLNNIKQVTELAMKALPEHKDVSDEPVDPDWFARFFDNVKDVSQEDMQKLWAKLLAGEVAQPGKFSLRTLDVLRNLSSAEARLLNRYRRFCTNDGLIIIPADGGFVESLQVGQSDTLRLIECGIFHDGYEFCIGGAIGKPSAAARYGDTTIHITRSNRKDDFFVTRVFRLTSVGMELANLYSYDADKAYIQAFCEAAERKGLVVRIADVTQHDIAAP